MIPCASLSPSSPDSFSILLCPALCSRRLMLRRETIGILSRLASSWVWLMVGNRDAECRRESSGCSSPPFSSQSCTSSRICSHPWLELPLVGPSSTIPYLADLIIQFLFLFHQLYISSILPSAGDIVVTKHITFATLMEPLFLWGVTDNKSEDLEQLNDTSDNSEGSLWLLYWEYTARG